MQRFLSSPRSERLSRQEICALLSENGFVFTLPSGLDGSIELVKMPDPEKLGRKLDLSIRYWLDGDDLCRFRLQHEDVMRLLYYLGKAVGSREGMDFLRLEKLKLWQSLYDLGVLDEAPPESAELVGL